MAGDVGSIDVIICGKLFTPVLEHFRQLMPEASLEQVEPERLAERVATAQVVIPAMTRIDDTLLSRAPNLRLVQQWGAGLDTVDLAAATRHGGAVANVPTPGTGNAESVAEWSVMAAIAVSRGFPGIQRQVQPGHPWGAPAGRALLGKPAGIVGFGGTGRALAERLRPFGLRLVAVKRSPDPALALSYGLDWIGDMEALPRLLQEADYLFLCAPLTDDTRGMIDDRAFGLLPDGAILVNAARGGLVDREALIRALDAGKLAGAALDVFWEEPLPPGDPLVERPNVLASPHIAGVTDVSYAGIAGQVAGNIRLALAGRLPRHCANPEVAAAWR